MHPLSSKALEWINSTLQTCKDRHVSCRTKRFPQLPKRILAIKSSIRGNVQIKLVENSLHRAPYAALSHCWGQEQTCVTTLATLSKHKKEISWHSVSKTFQDATRLALKLGISYLWIDSLCIIQDDPNDWDTESSNIADTYQNSYLTLAATASSGDSHGCFEEYPVSAGNMEFLLPLGLTDSLQIGIRPPLKHWNSISAGDYRLLFPLLSRAWVFQERMLSPRVLHICKSELVWQCREAASCECGGFAEGRSPGGEYHKSLNMNTIETIHSFPEIKNPIEDELTTARDACSLYDADLSRMKLQYAGPGIVEDTISYQTLRQLRVQSEEVFVTVQGRHQEWERLFELFKSRKETSELSRQFRKLVEQYSALELTRATDRLPALSGLCKKKIAPRRGEYVAGLWHDSLVFDLLWRVESLQPQSNCNRPEFFPRPSWSWISVPGSVKYWTDIESFLPTSLESLSREAAMNAHLHQRKPIYIKHHVKIRGKNEFGEVSEAALWIIGYSASAILEYAMDFQSTKLSADDPLKYTGRLGYSNHSVPIFADYALGFQGTHHVPNGSRVTLLLIHPQIALVLKPSTLKIGDSFANERQLSAEELWERIGIARVSDTLLDVYFVDWMRQAEIRHFIIV
jgi:hypothetical protein